MVIKGFLIVPIIYIIPYKYNIFYVSTKFKSYSTVLYYVNYSLGSGTHNLLDFDGSSSNKSTYVVDNILMYYNKIDL